MRAAQDAEAWEYVQGHQVQIALLRDRIAAKRQKYGELSAEYTALTQEEAVIRQQVAALEHDYYDIEDEIGQPAKPRGRAGR